MIMCVNVQIKENRPMREETREHCMHTCNHVILLDESKLVERERGEREREKFKTWQHEQQIIILLCTILLLR